MKINFVQIQNFRKLKNCRVKLSGNETLLVGANNSGKTSATDALICFLDKLRKITVTDFTLSNWSVLNQYAESWLSTDPKELKGQDISDWIPYCPSLDVWLDAGVEDVHRVAHLIPTLKWKGEPLGIRLTYEPKDIEKLRENFLQDFKAIDDLRTDETKLSFWPRDLKDYLNRKLSDSFVIRAYILDPKKISTTQDLPKDATPLEKDPFKGLFKVDTIEAQRGFTDPNSEQVNAGSTLSSQLHEYYIRHLNPTDLPDEEDLPALKAIEEAQAEFDKKLDKSFKGALGEIQALGYPGFSDPDIKLSSRVNPIDGLEHDAAVIFDIQKQGFDNHTYSLPEQYNGLGYKNLIHIVFKLITFRDRWQRIGKAQKRRTEDDVAIEPIHLVLVEEPEAHLHAQVQQVFIRKAYEVLRKGISKQFTTQMVLSTHSSYIAHEAGFEKLRYFKRKAAVSISDVPEAEVVDLSSVFGSGKKKATEDEQVLNTQKFVSRYLKTTHCDLFFANGIILVEGAAERMLLPHFINYNYPELRSSYLSILEVGGAHAQRLKPLIDTLALPTLVITDTDAKGLDGKKVQPERNNDYKYGSDTLREWFELKDLSLDDVLDLSNDKKVKGNVRAAYQYGFMVKYHTDAEEEEAIPYTFEDAIALSNIQLFRDLTSSTGMVKKMHEATMKDSLEECAATLYRALDGEKAKMALDLLYDVDPKKLKVPTYIDEGLQWLEKELSNTYQEFVFAEPEEVEEPEALEDL
ncbi:AAA family ATPase [Vibrio parahaemolyticus]|uniref:ATP-dependent nuclease n=1 Tax=Vibrio parahaemolyticus TaxID=670 RepID=UPI0004161B8D|nr:AAA family ATPase [Vibrio parahaemolyticus]EGQ7782459.1 AAA family ATPase [Vibrio parahaemolyticus]EHJ9984718.1 AAA family ATPase [Vibrio parahaemolyticus]EJG0723659.1 AAA family ATPase [Vibrio parahaemolyticus]EJG0798453.1 AAA family ATPase [Vibrio parahaemolyticus]MBE3770915.1 AAA family ATPase [Vibrio parahaemolyticus]